MSDFDRRHLLSFCEVHYWAQTGRVVIVNKPTSGDPIITDVRIHDAPDYVLRDSTFILALALAEASRPEADLFEHVPDGTVVNIGLAGAVTK